MTEARAVAELFGGVALLERAVGYTLGQLQAVTRGALTRPTPCEEWDLRALLAHMEDSLAAMQEAMDLRYVHPVSDAEAGDAGVGGDGLADAAGGPVSALRAQGCQLLGALAGADERLVWVGGYPVPVRLVASAGAIDVAVHGWDAGRACGSPGSIPAELAEDMLRIAPLLITSADRPGRFGAPVPVLREASAGDLLVAYLGRDPGWHARHHVPSPR
jgi:uncharacterized protein (TIGR03086 family)